MNLHYVTLMTTLTGSLELE